MKTFFILISGMVFALLLGAGGLFFLLQERETPAKRSEETRDGPTPAAKADPTQLFAISVNFVVPPPLFSKTAGNKKMLKFYVVDYPSGEGAISPVTRIYNPVFPYKAEIKLDRKEALRVEGQHPEQVAVTAIYGDFDAPQRTYTLPMISAYKRVPIPNLAKTSAPNGMKIDAGNIYFTKNYTLPANHVCEPGAAPLSGKITPTKAFLDSVKGNKVALLVLPFRVVRDSFDFNPVTESELASVVVHHQFLDFSHGPASFAVSAGRTMPPFYRLVAVQCQPQESLDACAAAGFPLLVEPGQAQSRNHFRVAGKSFEIPYCGQPPMEAYIHSPDQSAPTLGVPAPSPAGAAAPQEFVSGENI